MANIDRRAFADKMGFAARNPRPSNEGVVADWSQLPVTTKPFRQGFAYFAGGISPSGLDDGAGKAEWQYEGKSNKDHMLRITVDVCAGGQAAALRIMDRLGYMSNMDPSPYGPAPTSMKVGDWTAVTFPDRAASTGRVDQIFWVYRNVVTNIRVREAKMDVVSLARAIQAFMEKHQVDDLAAHVPKMAGFRMTPERPAVEQPFRVELQGKMLPSWRIRINNRTGDIRFLATHANAVELSARAPGVAEIEAVVLDEKTLLLSRYHDSVTIAATP